MSTRKTRKSVQPTKQDERKELLTQAACDWVENIADDYSECETEDLAGMGISATLDALGQGGEDEDSFDHDRVGQAAMAALLTNTTMGKS